MRPVQWEPPIELEASEQAIIKRIRRAKLFIFLREHRHELFDAAFQEDWRTCIKTARAGSRQSPRRSWRWPPSCKRIREPLTMR